MLDFFFMLFGALCCTLIGWAVVYSSTKIDAGSRLRKPARR
jgi:hypothetical protein